MNAILPEIRKLFVHPQSGGLTDGQLLEQFLANRDERSFTELMHRHGRMVFGVGQRVLRNLHDAEDVFQATFLVLARKAATITPRGAVGAWLYGVACRTAMKAKAMTAKRQLKERQSRERCQAAAITEDVWEQLQPLLDEELSRLPEKYQSAIVLCDLEGKTKREAAAQLHCPEGTLSSRVVRGRRLLAKRLARRGVTLSAGLLADALSQSAALSTVHVGLFLSTSQAVAIFASRPAATTGAISAKVAALTEGVMKSMLLSKLKVVMTALVTMVGVVGAAAVLHSYPLQASEPIGEERPQSTQDAKEKPPSPMSDSKNKALQTLIAKILKAHGGEKNLENLEKLKTFTMKVSAKSLTSDDRIECLYSVQPLGQMRAEVSYQFGDRSEKWIYIKNKDKKWKKENDQEAVPSKGEHDELYLMLLGPQAVLMLKHPDITVSLLGERMVGDTASLLGDRAAICVKMTGKNGESILPPHDPMNLEGVVEEVRLYFDKNTSLLLKVEYDGRWGSRYEIFHSDYKMIDGIAVAQKWIRTKGTQRTLNARTEIEFNFEKKLDAKLFEKP